MKTKKLLLELIELLESFEATVVNAETMGLDAFLTYVLSLRINSQEQLGPARTAYSDEATIAQMLSLLYRISRTYTKKALQGSKLHSEEEYTYLVSLLSAGLVSKTELNQRNALERTTGNEMIRRLQRSGFVRVQEDSRDKRQKLVEITAEGRAELMKVFPPLKSVATLLSSGLDDGQKLYLKNLLKQMTNEHLEKLKELRDAPLSDYLDYTPQ